MNDDELSTVIRKPMDERAGYTRLCVSNILATITPNKLIHTLLANMYNRSVPVAKHKATVYETIG